MNLGDLIQGLPPMLQLSVQLLLILATVSFGGAIGFRRGKVKLIQAGNAEKLVTAESLRLDDNAEMAEKLRAHEIRLRELEACIFGIAVHLSNIVLCDRCKDTNHQLLHRVSEMVANSAQRKKEPEHGGSKP